MLHSNVGVFMLHIIVEEHNNNRETVYSKKLSIADVRKNDTWLECVTSRPNKLSHSRPSNKLEIHTCTFHVMAG